MFPLMQESEVRERLSKDDVQIIILTGHFMRKNGFRENAFKLLTGFMLFHAEKANSAPEGALTIYHGTDKEKLEKGIGRYAGSVLPGENDTSVLSGQRDTVFRRIGEVERGNLLIVTTSAREFTCKVRKFRTVDANNRTVIVPKPRPTLTVTTCYPFRYIVDALERYIITADLIESKKEKGIRRAAWQSFFLW